MTSLLVNHILQTEKWTSPELFETKNRIYTFLNPVSYLIALENKSLFEQFDGIFADGSLLVSAIRLVYGKRVTRRSFDMTSLAPELLNYLMESRKTLYIVASGQEQVECSVRIFQEQYPMNLRFVYRMYKEKHTRTRYLQAAFLFPVRFIGERIFG